MSAPSATMPMSMILDRTLSICRTSPCLSVQSSSVHGPADRSFQTNCNRYRNFYWKTIGAMSEYPRSRLDKAALKFARQGSKKSQNVSVEVALFFSLLFGNSCRSM
jgi:hypothetical protein